MLSPSSPLSHACITSCQLLCSATAPSLCRYTEAEAVLQRVAVVNGYSRPLRLHLAPKRASRHAAGAAGEELLLSNSGSTAGSGAGGGGGMRSRSPAAALASSQFAAKVPASPELPLLGDLTSPAPHEAEPASSGGMHPDQASLPAADSGQASHDVLHAEDGSDGAAWGASGLRQRAKRLRRVVASSCGAIFGPQLRRTTLLLFAVWFTNALTYYGLVLLTTALQTAAKKEPCTPGGTPNLDASDYTVGGALQAAPGNAPPWPTPPPARPPLHGRRGDLPSTCSLPGLPWRSSANGACTRACPPCRPSWSPRWQRPRACWLPGC